MITLQIIHPSQSFLENILAENQIFILFLDILVALLLAAPASDSDLMQTEILQRASRGHSTADAPPSVLTEQLQFKQGEQTSILTNQVSAPPPCALF